MDLEETTSKAANRGENVRVSIDADLKLILPYTFFMTLKCSNSSLLVFPQCVKL